MKLNAQGDLLFGRLLITKLDSTIVVPDPTKNVTKAILVQSVGPEAEAAGYKIGDIVVPSEIGVMPMRAGKQHAFYCGVKKVLCSMTEVSSEDFIDSDGKTEIVSLDPSDPSHQGWGAAPS